MWTGPGESTTKKEKTVSSAGKVKQIHTDPALCTRMYLPAYEKYKEKSLIVPEGTGKPCRKLETILRITQRKERQNGSAIKQTSPVVAKVTIQILVAFQDVQIFLRSFK